MFEDFIDQFVVVWGRYSPDTHKPVFFHKGQVLAVNETHIQLKDRYVGNILILKDDICKIFKDDEVDDNGKPV